MRSYVQDTFTTYPTSSDNLQSYLQSLELELIYPFCQVSAKREVQALALASRFASSFEKKWDRLYIGRAAARRQSYRVSG